ncbi:MAG: galactitol-1-phosphate 5-dehydrogenase [Planctomycetota bacterium]
MRALLLTDLKQLEMVDIAIPSVADDEVLVRVAACGICGSDVHGYDGSSGRRIPPLVMGHEAAGIIESVGADVTQLQIGERVTFDSTVYCGDCDFCQAGRVNLCEDRQVLGVSCGDYRRYGAFAEFVVVPQRIVYRLPDALPLEHAALIEAVSVAVHAVGQVTIRSGDTAVVVGTGMIGLLVVQALRAAGCESIIGVDVDDDRLDLAQQLGATATINANDGAVSEKIADITQGRRADLALEAVGTTRTVATAIESTRKGGTVVLVGNISSTIDFPLQSVVTREIAVLGSCASAGEYPRCIELMASGAIDVSPLLTATASLEEGPEWFQRLYQREPGLMKVVLTPQAT